MHLDKDFTKATLPKYPLTEYAAEHWFEPARFEAVSKNVEEGMKQMFDRKQHHLATWLWIYDPIAIPNHWDRDESAETPQTPHGTPLHFATFCGLSAIVKFLAVEHPEDVNSQNFPGRDTPLHVNSQMGYVDVARILIEHGADVAAQDNLGGTPLHGVSLEGHVDLAQLLIEHGADVAAEDVDGSTPLHMACGGCCVDLAWLLIKHGADAAAETYDGWTPLHRLYSSSGDGLMDLARLLIEHGADATAQDEQGSTPLHEASKLGYVDVPRLLIEHGADTEAQDERGWTPLHWTSQLGHVNLARFLLEHGGANVAA